MLLIAYTLLIGAIGVIWSFKARNSFTKFISLLLSLSFLLPLAPVDMLKAYAPYVLAVASLMAGFEPSNSMRVKLQYKVYFGISGFLFAIVALENTVRWPFEMTLWPFVLAFLLYTGWVLIGNHKKLRTRLGILSVWVGMGLKCLISVL